MPGVLVIGKAGRSWDGPVVMEWAATGSQLDGGPSQRVGHGVQAR